MECNDNTNDENDVVPHRIICGDNIEVASRFLKNSVDFVGTSPPYANQRKKLYDSISEADYPEWTLEWMTAIQRLLKPTGSVAIVIRAHLKDGCVSPYVLKTRLALHDAGWRECQQIAWHKPGSLPTGRNNRMRQSWEEVLWFSRYPKLTHCDPRANGTPLQGAYPELGGGYSGNGRGFSGVFGRAYSPAELKALRGDRRKGALTPCKEQSGIARSTDVLRASPGSTHHAEYNVHPAKHPTILYRQLIRMLCPLGGVVLDPFAGSGTTMEASFLEGRHSISIEKKQDYVDICRRRLFDLESAERSKSTG